MGVRKASLLEFDSVDPSLYLSKELTIDHIFQELFQVDLEDPSSDVRPIVGLLLWVDVFPDLLPLRVASEGDKEVRFSFLDNDSHCVMISLSHVPLTSLECRGKYHLSTYLLVALLGLLLKVFLETYIVVYFHFFLMMSNVVEVVGFHSEVGSDNVLLEEPSSKVEWVKASSFEVLYKFLDRLFLISSIIRKSRLTEC